MKTLIDQFTPQRTAALSGALGEDQATIDRVVAGVVPGLLAGLLQRAETRNFGDLAPILQPPAGRRPPNLDDLITSVTRGGSYAKTKVSQAGGGLVRELFPQQTGTLIDTISRGARADRGTTAAVIRVVAPYLATTLGAEASPTDWLLQRRADIRAALPDYLTELLPPANGRRAHPSKEHSGGPAAGVRPWVWLLVGVLVLALLVYLVRSA